MKTYTFTLLTALLTVSGAIAQTASGYALTRQQTIQKGRVLRKNAKDKGNGQHIHSGTRGMSLQKDHKVPGSSRTIPMVTKPLAPASQ